MRKDCVLQMLVAAAAVIGFGLWAAGAILIGQSRPVVGMAMIAVLGACGVVLRVRQRPTGGL